MRRVTREPHGVEVFDDLVGAAVVGDATGVEQQQVVELEEHLCGRNSNGKVLG